MGREEALPGSGDADPFVDCDEGSSAIELARPRGDARGPLGAEMDVTTREGLHPPHPRPGRRVGREGFLTAKRSSVGAP